MIGLTDRQAQVLTTMVRHFESTSLWPTQREIMAALNIKSTNSIICHFELLERKGFVERVGEHKSRACRVVRLPSGVRVVPRLVPATEVPSLEGQRCCP